MKKIFLSLILGLAFTGVWGQSSNRFVTSDIANFWAAYDKITTSTDTLQQQAYLKTLFLDKASPGQKAMIQARRYTPAEYLLAIKRYPKFWASVRPNTLKADAYAQEIEAGIRQLKTIYPGLKSAQVYFTVGALRSNGTILNGMVLIGSELAMADEHTVTSEFSDNLGHLPSFFANNPIQGIAFLNVHEFVHTLQKTTIGYNLLTQCVYEGVAEFVAVIATGKPSTTPAIDFGKKNDARVKERFAKEMFSPFYNNWLWNNADNEFKMRDLGYYVGYAMAEKQYNQTADKKQAIKELIELDYTNWVKLTAFVNNTGYFSKPVAQLREEYEKNRPTVLDMQGLQNGDQNVSPGLVKITLRFSTRMDTRQRGFEWGLLGQKKAMTIKDFEGFSEDGKSVSFTVELQPGRRYQMYASNRFRNPDGVPLKPYLINIRTADAAPSK